MEGTLERTMGGSSWWFWANPYRRNKAVHGHHWKKAASSHVGNQAQQGRRVRRLEYPGAQSHPTGALG
eukprot:7590009-Heterocapsa_arctica.AAC.1